MLLRVLIRMQQVEVLLLGVILERLGLVLHEELLLELRLRLLSE